MYRIVKKAGLLSLLILPLLLSFSIGMVRSPSTNIKISHVWSWSGDSPGSEKNSFMPSDEVWCKIQTQGLGSLTVDIYITYNDEWQKVGPTPPPLTDRSDGVETVILTNSGPDNVKEYYFRIWEPMLIKGEFDIVLDENQNGVRDPGESVDDSSTVEGFFVIPEISTILLTLASFGAFTLIAMKQKGINLKI